MSASDERDEAASERQVEAFLTTLRRSAEIAQELLRTTSQQNERIRSLEAELDSARGRLRFLENEISELRGKLGPSGVPREPKLDQLPVLEELIDEQNCLAHMFVTSDRLARAPSAAATLEVAVEVMHNLVGASAYAIFLRWGEADAVLVAPGDAPSSRALAPHRELVAAALDTGRWQRGAGAGAGQLPVCVPLRLEGAVVGAVLVLELIPHIGAMKRLQIDLLGLLADRLAPSLCLGALQGPGGRDEAWMTLRAALSGQGPDGRGPRA